MFGILTVANYATRWDAMQVGKCIYPTLAKLVATHHSLLPLKHRLNIIRLFPLRFIVSTHEHFRDETGGD